MLVHVDAQPFEDLRKLWTSVLRNCCVCTAMYSTHGCINKDMCGFRRICKLRGIHSCSPWSSRRTLSERRVWKLDVTLFHTPVGFQGHAPTDPSLSQASGLTAPLGGGVGLVHQSTPQTRRGLGLWDCSGEKVDPRGP